MKIGVIADTHIPVSAKELPRKVYDHFKDCDIIVHAGDILEMSVIEELGKLAEVKAVRGNMDSDQAQKELPQKIVFQAAGKTIGVVHGGGSSFNALQTAKKAFKKKCDIIIFGHTHMPISHEIEGTLFFNPGSASDKVFAPYRSFGIIRIEGDRISAEIIKLD